MQKEQSKAVKGRGRASRRKYRAGAKIRSLDTMVGEPLVFVGFARRRPIPSGFFLGWQLKYAKHLLSRGMVRKAVRIEKEVAL